MKYEDFISKREPFHFGPSGNEGFQVASLALPPVVVKDIPMATETKPSLFGIPIHEAHWVPENMGLLTAPCYCTPEERSTLAHIGKHVVILDFRTDEQRAADAEKYQGNSEAA